MATLAIGDVVLVAFPFSDLTFQKKRPAMVIAPCGGEDYLLSMISSHAYNDPDAIAVPEKDFRSGGLDIPCVVRPRHLFSAHHKIMLKKLGHFSPGFTREIRKMISVWILDT